MKIPILDLGVLAKYLLPATILVGIMVYLFIRQIVVFFWQATHSTKVHRKVGELRKAQTAPQVVVRKTDLFAQLTSEQKKLYLRAQQLADMQQFREAAKIFESIHFQRKAIDLLESHGLIDEACAILLRMGVPYRAGVVYERNGHFHKASECFLKDGKPDQAARCFEKMGEKDFTWFRKAAECYLQGGMIDNALAALSRIEASDELLRTALTHQRLEFLQRYLDLSFHAQALLPQMGAADLETLIKAVALTPQGATTLAHWTMYRPDETMVLGALLRLGGNRVLAAVFWNRLDDGFCDFICGLLGTLARKPSTDIVTTHAEALTSLGRTAYADRLRALVGASGDTKTATLAIGL